MNRVSTALFFALSLLFSPAVYAASATLPLVLPALTAAPILPVDYVDQSCMSNCMVDCGSQCSDMFGSGKAACVKMCSQENGQCKARCTRAGDPPSSPTRSFVYDGGELITAPQVVVVYWGTQEPGLPAFLNDFYRRITQSTYTAPLAEYSVENQPIGSARFMGGFFVNQDDARLLDSIQIAREIEQLATNGTLPTANAHTVYMIHFGPAVRTVMGANIFGLPAGATPGTGYCAYHGTTRTATPVPPVPGIYAYGQKVRFAVLPDPKISGCKNGSDMLTPFEETTFTATHELVESITNPDAVIFELGILNAANVQCNAHVFAIGSIIAGVPPPLPILGGAAPYAWTDGNNGVATSCNPQEIADSCNNAASFATTANPDGTYKVSPFKLNSTGMCQVSQVQRTVTDPPPPTPPSNNQLCLQSCLDEQNACIASAHTGQERGFCGQEAKRCRSACQ